MDLGATICTTREPRCLLCPLAKGCEARLEGDPARLPIKAKKKAKPVRQGAAYWIERDRAVWLIRREAKGMLGGMRALPDDGWSAQGDGSGEAPLMGEWQAMGRVSHTFTHAQLELAVSRYAGHGVPQGEGEWWPLARLDEAGLPTLYAKAARLALA